MNVQLLRRSLALVAVFIGLSFAALTAAGLVPARSGFLIPIQNPCAASARVCTDPLTITCNAPTRVCEDPQECAVVQYQIGGPSSNIIEYCACEVGHTPTDPRDKPLWDCGAILVTDDEGDPLGWQCENDYNCSGSEECDALWETGTNCLTCTCQ